MAKIRCLQCLEILESQYRHHFVQCHCPNQTFVDGGNSYLRCGAVDLSLIEVLETPQDTQGENNDPKIL